MRVPSAVPAPQKLLKPLNEVSCSLEIACGYLRPLKIVCASMLVRQLFQEKESTPLNEFPVPKIVLHAGLSMNKSRPGSCFALKVAVGTDITVSCI